MKFHRMYALFLRHIYLIKGSLPRILDLIYWPTIQIVLWGFISKFFSIYSDYYSNTLGVILTCAILYDILRKISSNSELNFKLKSENKLSLKSENSDFNLLCLPIDNFPSFAEEIEGQELSLNKERFLKLLNKTKKQKRTKIIRSMDN